MEVRINILISLNPEKRICHFCKLILVSTNQFKYREGTTYLYRLDLTLSGSTNQPSRITGTLQLSQLLQCQQLIRLKNVQVTGPMSHLKGFVEDLQKQITFINRDGIIEENICVESTDPMFSLNIKRAIASMFQVAVGETNEVRFTTLKSYIEKLNEIWPVLG